MATVDTPLTAPVAFHVLAKPSEPICNLDCPYCFFLSALAEELRPRLNSLTVSAVGASSLTAAELRVLSLLPTHLTFQEIGERLYVSRNTVKTQAKSVYRKLGVASRSEAIDRVQELGSRTSA